MRLMPPDSFKNIGIDLIQKKRISCIPIMPREKMPAYFDRGMKTYIPLNKWNEFFKRLATEEEYNDWANYPQLNIGVCTGELSQIVALDFDNHDELHQKIFEQIPDSPCAKKGALGITKFYRFSGEKNRKWIHPESKKVVVELLSDGRQTVIPPSIHPSEKPYRWIGVSLAEVDTLPKLPDNLTEIIEGIIGTAQKPLREMVFENTGSDLENVQKALTFINADCDYETWIKIGMALHSWSGGNALDLFESWSRTGKKYKEGECEKKWSSFHGSSRQIASLFFEAKQNGFIVTKLMQETYDLPDSFFVNSYKKTDNKTPKELAIKNLNGRLFIPEDIVASTPNTAGDILRWILSTAVVRQPELSMAGAIAFLGMIKGQRVRTETNLRTNMYMLGVAPASCGKGHPIMCLNALLEDAGLEHLSGGTPASDAGLLAMLEDGGRKIVIWDEMGKAFSALTGNKVQAFQSQIITLLMQLFSCANQTYKGKQYARREGKMTARNDIREPCLCLFGLTTPEPLFNSLSEEMISDGFLSRLLIFEPRDPYPEPIYGIKDCTPPRELVERILFMNDTLGERNGLGGIRAKIVPYSPSASVLINELRAKYYNKKRESHASGEGMQSFWGRAMEHIEKLALTVSEGYQIEYGDVFWANQVVSCCINNLLEACRNLDQTDFSKIVDKAIAKLKNKGEAVKLSDFKNDLRHLARSKKEMDDLLSVMREVDEAKVALVKNKQGKSVEVIVHIDFVPENLK